MNTLHIETDALRDTSRQAQSSAGALGQQSEDLSRGLDVLRAAWQSSQSEDYCQRVEAWLRRVKALQDELAGMADALQRQAEAWEDTDRLFGTAASTGRGIPTAPGKPLPAEPPAEQTTIFILPPSGFPPEQYRALETYAAASETHNLQIEIVRNPHSENIDTMRGSIFGNLALSLPMTAFLIDRWSYEAAYQEAQQAGGSWRSQRVAETIRARADEMEMESGRSPGKVVVVGMEDSAAIAANLPAHLGVKSDGQDRMSVYDTWLIDPLSEATANLEEAERYSQHDAKSVWGNETAGSSAELRRIVDGYRAVSLRSSRHD